MTITKEKIVQFIEELPHPVKYNINSDLSVNVVGHVDLSSKQLTELPFKFRTVKGSFNCSYNELSSLKNCPDVVAGDFRCSANNLEHFDYLPTIIGGDFLARENIIKDLKGIHKKIRKVGGGFFTFPPFSDYLPTHLLGVFLIEGIVNINADGGGDLSKIINKHLEQQQDWHTRIYACQEELIEAGFVEQAKL